MTIELKPCPFCGCAIHLLYKPESGMFGPEGDHKPGCMIMNFDFCDYVDEFTAISDWNTRAAKTAPET